MSLDYYGILGVSKDATVEAIQKAYRRRAIACHPDCNGGSHEAMKKVNEAWYILGNPERRRHYDESQTASANPASRETAQAEAQEAAQQAEHYPQKWSEFESWLNQVAADVHNAQYGQASGHYNTSWPTASNSQSASTFIFAGSAAGACIAIVLLFVGIGNLFQNPTMKAGFGLLRFGAVGVVGSACIGAWLGYALHKSLRSVVPTPQTPRSEPPRRETQATQDKTTIQCPQCGQKLRIPAHLQGTLRVTCTACRHGFEYPSPQPQYADGAPSRDPAVQRYMDHKRRSEIFKLWPFGLAIGFVILLAVLAPYMSPGRGAAGTSNATAPVASFTLPQARRVTLGMTPTQVAERVGLPATDNLADLFPDVPPVPGQVCWVYLSEKDDMMIVAFRQGHVFSVGAWNRDGRALHRLGPTIGK